MIQVTKVWWDGEKLMAEPIDPTTIYQEPLQRESDFWEGYQPEPTKPALVREDWGPGPHEVHSLPPAAPVQDSTCNETLRAQGKAYPRTCRKCGLGPCIGAPKPPPAQPAPVQEPKMYEDWYDSSSCGHCGMVNGHRPECRHNYKTPAQPAPVQEPVAKPKLIGWRTADFLNETTDIKQARSWDVHYEVLPIFEGDPNTKLATPPAQPAPAQEPVACVQDLDEVKRKHLVYVKGMDWKDPLYTTPPAQRQWTDIDIDKLSVLAGFDPSHKVELGLVRSVVRTILRTENT